MCKRCETEDGYFEIFSKGGLGYNDNDFEVWNEEDNVYLVVGGENAYLARGRATYDEGDFCGIDSDDTLVIGYCPFCGRKLAEPPAGDCVE